MNSDFTVSFQGDHVRIDSKGERNLDYARALWTEVAQTCRKHDCFSVLGVSYAPAPMSTIDGFHHVELFRKLGLHGQYKIAWAELNDDVRDASIFVETVLTNRGLSCKIFSTEEEAVAWLLPQPEQVTT